MRYKRGRLAVSFEVHIAKCEEVINVLVFIVIPDVSTVGTPQLIVIQRGRF